MEAVSSAMKLRGPHGEFSWSDTMAPHRREVTGRKPRVTAASAKRRAKHAEASADQAHNETASDDEASGELEADGSDDEASGEQEPTPHPELVPHAHNRPPPIRGPPAAYSIRQFCREHNISESMYFKMRAMGLGPREMAVGTRRLITKEAAAEWRKAREAAADTA
jgi:hypothetical protein